MIRVYVLCEGQTEGEFVRSILNPHFKGMSIDMSAIIFRTGPRGKGGITTYQKMKRQIVTECKRHRRAKVTVLWDLYPLPSDFPFKETVTGNPEQKAKAVKQALKDDINLSNFIPNIVVHEFEGLLFSDPVVLGKVVIGKNRKAVERLVAVKEKFPTPEHINDGPTTAPSKRIIKVIGKYDKVTVGAQTAMRIGLDTIRRKCPVFDSWVREIENLSKDRCQENVGQSS